MMGGPLPRMRYQRDLLNTTDVSNTYKTLLNDCARLCTADIQGFHQNGLLPLPCACERVVGMSIFYLSPCRSKKYRLPWPPPQSLPPPLVLHCLLHTTWCGFDTHMPCAFHMQKSGEVCVLAMDHNVIDKDVNHPMHGIVSKHDMYFFAEVLFCMMQPSVSTMYIHQIHDLCTSVLMEADVDDEPLAIR